MKKRDQNQLKQPHFLGLFCIIQFEFVLLFSIKLCTSSFTKDVSLSPTNTTSYLFLYSSIRSSTLSLRKPILRTISAGRPSAI
eukprot:m.14150 g.14150  ORF g.14150 m.14150 type:complete len:83 (-) comp4265_c0_seq1:690-938(-)